MTQRPNPNQKLSILCAQKIDNNKLIILENFKKLTSLFYWIILVDDYMPFTRAFEAVSKFIKEEIFKAIRNTIQMNYTKRWG